MFLKMRTKRPKKETTDAVSALSAAGQPQRDEASGFVPQGRKVGRPRREVPTLQRTVSFTHDVLDMIEELADRSGRRGTKRPDFSKTVRVGLRLATAFAPPKEIKKAFDQELEA